MSNLKLVPDDPTPMEKLLLDASRAEQPSDEHKARMRALLGIGLPLSGPLAAPPPAVPGQAAGLAPGAVGKSATLGKVALGVGVAALIGAFVFTRQHDGGQPPQATVKPVVVAPVAAVPVAPAAKAAAEAAPAISPLPPVETPAPVVTPHAARSDASASAESDLGEQIRLIEAARAGVAAHDAKAATAALDAYAAKFPRGSFGQEAMVLRIRAIDQAGDFARATALAKSFVARFPNSPHVARLKPIAERGASR
ncbi:MAG: outer membrane protein assembly factor BamD [Myxococcales bacterium]